MIKDAVKRIARTLGVEIVRTERLNQLEEIEADTASLFNRRSSVLGGHSNAQLYQDIIVLLATDFKQDGFFVEFGAANGIDLSNTYLLEKQYNWKGILAEPGKAWHDALSRNRDVHVDFSCVWRKSNEILTFNMVDSAEFSTISEFSDGDHHAQNQDQGFAAI